MKHYAVKLESSRMMRPRKALVSRLAIQHQYKQLFSILKSSEKKQIQIKLQLQIHIHIHIQLKITKSTYKSTHSLNQSVLYNRMVCGLIYCQGKVGKSEIQKILKLWIQIKYVMQLGRRVQLHVSGTFFKTSMKMQYFCDVTVSLYIL